LSVARNVEQLEGKKAAALAEAIAKGEEDKEEVEELVEADLVEAE
jgi:hypothetical protein